MTCPKCGSDNVQAIAETNSKTKGYGCCKGGLGYVLFGYLGLLCGLCGMGKGTSTTNILWICNSCGNKFK